MKKVLFLYSSCEGQTIKILHYIEDKLSDGYQCEFLDLHTMPKINLLAYDKVLIGASVRYGHLNKKLYAFIKDNLSDLNKTKAAFFCVNLTARKVGKDTPQGSSYVQKFISLSPWQPKLIGVFAGALRYPNYRFFDRVMIQLIMRLTGGETDTSKEVEYTNWDQVCAFSEQFAEL